MRHDSAKSFQTPIWRAKRFMMTNQYDILCKTIILSQPFHLISLIHRLPPIHPLPFPSPFPRTPLPHSPIDPVGLRDASPLQGPVEQRPSQALRLADLGLEALLDLLVDPRHADETGGPHVRQSLTQRTLMGGRWKF